MTKVNFPFSAVTGNQLFKLALILSAINPAIGGVLVSGPRGAAKSTLARAIVDILPSEAALVTLPLGASEEMLIGTLDLQQVLNEQQLKFSPGLLAKADQGVLYVDEVNLLADPLVDLLLDVCASGVNYIERDGISHQHQSQFILLGTMNPDEGEVRAQLSDRFGLCVDLDEKLDISQRVEIVRLRENFDRDPQAFIDSYQAQQSTLQQQIVDAKSQLACVVCSDDIRIAIATRCVAANVDGLRADIVWLKAAQAHAAWCGNQQVSHSDLDAVVELVLSHRRKEQVPPNQPPTNPSNKSAPQPPFSRPPSVQPPSLGQSDTNSDADTQDNGSGTPSDKSDNSPEQDNSLEPDKSSEQDKSGEWGSMAPRTQQTSLLSPCHLPPAKAVKKNVSSAPANSLNQLGQIVGGQKKSARLTNSINWFSTLANALGQWPPPQLKFKRANTGQPLLHLVMLDTSGSTLGRQQFGHAKAVVKQIAQQAYAQRELLAIFGFGNQQVQLIFAAQKAPKQLDNLLDQLTAGGGTPLRDVLSAVLDYQQHQQAAKPNLAFRNYLITDGRISQQVTDIKLQGDTTVVDVEDGAVKHGRGQEIAQQLAGNYVLLPA